MKYNLSDILESSDTQETEKFIGSVKINYNETIAEKIKEKVLNDEKEQKKKPFKIGRFSLKTILAFAAVVAIILCSITAAASVVFKMDKTFSKVFSSNIDLNTIAVDVNVVTEYNGYKFTLNQVICDGRTIYCSFDCPSENGEMLVPDGGYVTISINGKTPNSYSSNFYVFNRICYFYFTILDDNYIPSNSKIQLDFQKITYNYDMNRKDIAEKLLATGKVTEEEVEAALQEEFKIYEMADELLNRTPVLIDGEWSFSFKTGNTDVMRKIASDAVYPYDNSILLEITPFGAYIISSNDNPDLNNFNYKNIFCIEMKDGTVYTQKDTVEIENGYHDGIVSSGYYNLETGEGRTVTKLFLAEFINPNEVKSVSYKDVVLFEE